MIETERLILRRFEENDAQAMFNNWASDPEVTKYLTWPTHQNIETTKFIINIWLNDYENNPHRFGIVLKETNELIGSIDVVSIENNIPEIGYVLSRKYWSQGIMTEACKALINYLFEFGFNKIKIKAVVENIGSNKVIEKCGFIFTSKEKITIEKETKEIKDVNVYELIK